MTDEDPSGESMKQRDKAQSNCAPLYIPPILGNSSSSILIATQMPRQMEDGVLAEGVVFSMMRPSTERQ
jgi:hypothetical protein